MKSSLPEQERNNVDSPCNKHAILHIRQQFHYMPRRLSIILIFQNKEKHLPLRFLIFSSPYI